MKKPTFFLLVVMLLFLVIPTLRAEASSQILSDVSGNTGFVVINQQTVIQINSSYNGLSVEERAKLVEARLKKIAATGGINKELLHITERNGHLGLSYNGEWLIMADPASAYAQKTTQAELVGIWRNNLVAMLPNIDGRYKVVETMNGMASWYGKEFRGRKTANGDRYDERNFTAAHRSLKFGTKVRVTNLTNGLSVVVTINDRGPWVKSRLIDLSWASAQAIGIRGVGHVKVEVLGE